MYVFNMIGCLATGAWPYVAWLVTDTIFLRFPCVQLKVLDLAYLAYAHLDPFIRKQTSNQVLLDS